MSGLQRTPESQQEHENAIAAEMNRLNSPAGAILEAIHRAAHKLPPPGDDRRLMETMAIVSTLLVKLADDAEKMTRRIEYLTKWLLGLTVVLSILTAILVWIGFIQPPAH
ncbi:MAG TPA: hypothetical protein VGO67_12435 [Verrucomicrobiae bacterium]|jgi:hypothetical protein